MKKSKLLFGKYSYISIFSSSWMQQPKSLTRFLCWSLDINLTSFINSFIPCPEVLDNLLTAISCPLPRLPWNYIPCLTHKLIQLKLITFCQNWPILKSTNKFGLDDFEQSLKEPDLNPKKSTKPKMLATGPDFSFKFKRKTASTQRKILSKPCIPRKIYVSSFKHIKQWKIQSFVARVMVVLLASVHAVNRTVIFLRYFTTCNAAPVFVNKHSMKPWQSSLQLS